MANRSYLYSTNLVPGPDAKANGRKIVGISEWNYDIPIVFKLLISGNPKTCSSSIWNHPEQIALIGDYDAGVKNLKAFLSKVSDPAAQPLIDQATAFLDNPENQHQYFILECGEIFELGDTPLPEQNLTLLQQVGNLQPEIDEALQSLQPPPVAPPKSFGLISKLLGRTPEPPAAPYDPKKAVRALGFGIWSNHLYFDPS